MEIRCELKKGGRLFGYALYHPLFPVRGEGSLKMDNGITFLPNDRYLLENEKFRLYYTAAGDEAHNFIVVVEDNFSKSYELEFDFNPKRMWGWPSANCCRGRKVFGTHHDETAGGRSCGKTLRKFCAMFRKFGG